MKKFSIITACLNAEKYISETIDSVINQTIFLKSECLIEYIIIDGGSTDNTNVIISDYKKKFPQILHICEKDSGLYDALSKGFKLITGDIVCYLNAGDFLNKTAFSVLNQVFDNSNINWVTGIKFIYNEKSEIIDMQIPYKYRKNLIRSGIYGSRLPFIQQESTFWRKELLNNLDFDFFKKLKLSGDMYLWCEFAKKNSLYIIYSYLAGFKYHDNQLSFRYNKNIDAYVEETKKFIKKKNILSYIQIILDSPFWFVSRNLIKIFSIFNNKYYLFPVPNKSWIAKKKFKQIELFCWVCDYYQTNGEGILANIFINKYKFKNNIDDNDIYILNLKTNNKLSEINKNSKILIEKNNLTFLDKYISPFVGIFYLWIKYLQGKKIMYVNFLPLWNFFLFMLLPPSTILGPITGTKNYDEKELFIFEKFFRKFLMIPFFKISIFFLGFRFNNLIFSTRNLFSFLPDKVIRKSKFNFILEKNILDEEKKLVEKKFNDREYDFIFYIRFYPTKGNRVLIEYIEILKKNYKIITVGDKLNISGIKEFGHVSRNEVLDLCLNSKFSFLSIENFYSLFLKDCLISNTKVFFNKFCEYDKKFELENKVFPIDYREIEKNIDYIKKKFNFFKIY